MTSFGILQTLPVSPALCRLVPAIHVLAWWFETRGVAALLTTRVERLRIANSCLIAHRSPISDLILRSRASGVSKDAASDSGAVTDVRPDAPPRAPATTRSRA